MVVIGLCLPFRYKRVRIRADRVAIKDGWQSPSARTSSDATLVDDIRRSCGSVTRTEAASRLYEAV
jgi:hypothetical protein